MTDLSIIIVTWNTRELALACVQSIITHTRGITYEVIIVDNASSDGGADALAHEFPSAHLIRNTANRGFAAAVNQGIARARGNAILLLNPDTALVDNAFLRMVECMRSRPDVGIIGPSIQYPDGRIQPSCRSFPTASSQALILLKLHNLFPRLAPLRSYFLPDFDYTRTQTVDQVMGACFLISRAAVKKIGAFDESFFIWFEEVDFCKRAQDAGLHTLYFADAHLVHHKGTSFAQVNRITKQRYLNRSLVRYFRKHGSGAQTLLLQLLTPISLALAAIAQLTQIAKPNKDL